MKDNLAGKKYSLIVDKSTDISIQKSLAICGKYYSEFEQKIIVTFMSIVPILHGTREAFFKAVELCLEWYSLDFSDWISLGTDGATTMTDEYNSLWSCIRECSPNCTLFSCVCHSLHLCVKHAFEKLPSSVGYLLSKISLWFSRSNIRCVEYKELFIAMLENEDQGSETIDPCALPIAKISVTRWLVRGKRIDLTLKNMPVLRIYFEKLATTDDQEIHYKACAIHDMLMDDINLVYLIFLNPVVAEFDWANKFFQATHADPEQMVKELCLHHGSLRSSLYDSRGYEKPLSCVSLDTSFRSHVERYLHEHRKHPVKPGSAPFPVQVEQTKQRCCVS